MPYFIRKWLMWHSWEELWCCEPEQTLEWTHALEQAYGLERTLEQTHGLEQTEAGWPAMPPPECDEEGIARKLLCVSSSPETC